MLFQNIHRLSIASGNIRERSIIINRAQDIVTISAIYSRRFYGSETFDCKKADTSESKKAKPKVPPLPDPCADKICNRKIRKKSFWRRLLEPVEDPPLPPKECCRAKPQVTCDPDLSEFGGKAYRTCGSAYIIQKDILPVEDCEEDKESKILKKMEVDLDFKNVVTDDPLKESKILKKMEVDLDFKNVVTDDPLPKFKSAELRLLELSDNKLHAAYKKYNTVMKKHIEQKKMKLYKTVAWPIDMHEIPARFNINKTLLEKKNLEYVEFKRMADRYARDTGALQHQQDAVGKEELGVRRIQEDRTAQAANREDRRDAEECQTDSGAKNNDDDGSRSRRIGCQGCCKHRTAKGSSFRYFTASGNKILKRQLKM
ncbi:hypothetical protein QE152_g1669 [Popillia japonica]|uniref:Uncharacterized protein n=1 Tax=Popillia japonica TaxID=7064 RepID=A0AAW1N701_POPJA